MGLQDEDRSWPSPFRIQTVPRIGRSRPITATVSTPLKYGFFLWSTRGHSYIYIYIHVIFSLRVKYHVSIASVVRYFFLSVPVSADEYNAVDVCCAHTYVYSNVCSLCFAQVLSTNTLRDATRVGFENILKTQVQVRDKRKNLEKLSAYIRVRAADCSERQYRVHRSV